MGSAASVDGEQPFTLGSMPIDQVGDIAEFLLDLIQQHCHLGIEVFNSASSAAQLLVQLMKLIDIANRGMFLSHDRVL